MGTNQQESTLLDKVIGVVFWLAIIAAGIWLISYLGSHRPPPLAAEFLEATQRARVNNDYNYDQEATWAVQEERDREAQDDYATYEAEEYEEMQRYDEWQQEEADRREMEGMIEEAIRCADPGAPNC